MANHTRHFKISFLDYDSYHGNENELAEAQGLFQFLVRGMKFTYDPIDKYDYSGDLSEIDIGIIHQLPVTESSMKRFNLNYPFQIEEVTFAVRSPEYSPRIMALFQTLSPTVWLSLLASTILFALVCYVALKHRHTLADVILHILAICLNQEGNLVSKRAGEFILLCTWLVAMAFFTLCFKSVLLSFLSFPPLTSVRTVPELAAAIRAGEYIAYTGVGSFIPYLQSPNEDIRVIGESMMNTSGNNPVYLFAEHIEPENYPAFPKKAYVNLRSYLSIPGVYVSKENLRIQSYATFVGKDFCCKDEVDMLVHRFMASGIDKKIRHFREYCYFMVHYNYFQNYGIPFEKPEDFENRKLTLTDLGGAFILLVVGHFLSFCVLIIELLVKRRDHCPKRKLRVGESSRWRCPKSWRCPRRVGEVPKEN